MMNNKLPTNKELANIVNKLLNSNYAKRALLKNKKRENVKRKMMAEMPTQQMLRQILKLHMMQKSML